MSDLRERLREIRTFPSLVKFLREELDWPISSTADFEDLTFEYTPEELGIDPNTAAKIETIQRLRPLSTKQPWGIFFVKFEPKKLPVVALRRLLSQVALKKRASANREERAAWAADDLLFISNYGEGDQRQITFAHFLQRDDHRDLPTLKVLGWDNLDTPLHLDNVAEILTDHLAWPGDENDIDRWRESWGSAFTLRHREVITTARDLSIRLAELARAIRDRIRAALAIETAAGPLTKLMTAFREALLHDLDANGFADTYAQTIAYGLLSARITNPRANSADDLMAHMPLTNPFLRELMETFLHVGGRRGKAGGPGIDFDELGVSEVMELLDHTNMEAVVRDFGDRNPQEDPVIHFYEHFLDAYDKKQKISRGVFYTPRQVVWYIVRSVDELLRTEFRLDDGLADTTTWGEMAKRFAHVKIPDDIDPGQPFVQILDPAAGTGTFLVEVIDLVHRKMREKWKAQGDNEEDIRARWNNYVPKHLLPRLHGYELLMAPYAIAHLKVGLKLYETGYRFGDAERARIYLTNTLEPPHDYFGRFDFAIPALAHEAQAVNSVKLTQCFTVVIGNPPYSNFGQLNRVPFILDLLEDYKRDLYERKLNLDDDFIKFVRLAQYILARPQCGVLGMITNNAYLDGITHRTMRRYLLEQFNHVTIVDLHGNIRRAETTREGLPDENVFDIMQGVAISILATPPYFASHVRVAHIRGTREEKYAALTERAPLLFGDCVPEEPYFLFATANRLAEEYDRGIPLSNVFTTYHSLIQTQRDRLVIQFTERELQAVLDDLRQLPDEAIREKYRLTPDGRDWALADAKADVMSQSGSIVKIAYRPFDFRYTYYTGRSRGFMAYPRDAVMRHMLPAGSRGLVFKRQAREDRLGYTYFLVCGCLLSQGLFAVDPRGREYLAPLDLGEAYFTDGIPSRATSVEAPNFTSTFLQLVASQLGLSQTGPSGLPEGVTAEELFNYCYAICYSGGYRDRYADLLKIDYPKLPLTGSRELLRALSDFGGELVAVHLMESPVLDRAITAYKGPDAPLVARPGWSDDTVWLDTTATRRNQSGSSGGTIGFVGVPRNVWEFEIGGYQVCEQWLKDRKGRTLSTQDVSHYHKIVVALSETIRLMHEIDTTIEGHGGWPGAFTTATATATRSEGKRPTSTVAKPTGDDQPDVGEPFETSTSAIVEKTQRDIAKRMKELEPLVREYDRLDAADKALGARQPEEPDAS